MEFCLLEEHSFIFGDFQTYMTSSYTPPEEQRNCEDASLVEIRVGQKGRHCHSTISQIIFAFLVSSIGPRLGGFVEKNHQLNILQKHQQHLVSRVQDENLELIGAIVVTDYQPTIIFPTHPNSKLIF